jgi:hypothetical protein
MMPQPASGEANPSKYPEPGAGGVAKPAGAAGGLKVLPWAGFKGAVTYSFDDSNKSQFDNGAKILALNVPFTWFLQTGKSAESNNDFYHKAFEAGHEIANHTESHGSGSADTDIKNAQKFINDKYKVAAYTMAAPNGNTGTYNTVTKELFLLDRGVSSKGVGPDDKVDDTLMLNFPTRVPDPGATGNGQIDMLTDAARTAGKWQTFCIHGFGGDGYNSLDFQPWVTSVTAVKTKADMWIGTFADVGAYFVGRQLVAKATPTAKDGGQEYTWTLPKIFPPKRYVRVTVDGGTVSQDGKALPWNEHGYYEVALDAGKLTITP